MNGWERALREEVLELKNKIGWIMKDKAPEDFPHYGDYIQMKALEVGIDRVWARTNILLASRYEERYRDHDGLIHTGDVGPLCRTCLPVESVETVLNPTCPHCLTVASRL